MSHKNGTPAKPAKPPAKSPPVETDLMLATIEPSPLNPRKKFDQAKLAELAESVRVHGLLQRVLVWQPEKGRRRYELIDGERRYRAAKLARLSTIPATVLDCTAKEARELSLIANIQREDLTTMEEADAYAELVKEHGYTTQALAEKIGRSPQTVGEFVKLSTHVRTVPLLRAALDNGRVGTRVALLVARIPNEAMRDEAARYVLCGWTAGPIPSAGDVKHATKEDKPALNVALTRDLIRERYMAALKEAVFDPKDAQLVPAAGSCTVCPKRAGNNRTDYPDTRGDVCCDPACYRAKEEAHREQLMQRHQEAGRLPLPRAEGDALFDQWAPNRLNIAAREQYVDLAEPCAESATPGQTWGDMIGAQCADDIKPVRDPTGEPHELVPRKVAMRVLRAEHDPEALTPPPERERATKVGPEEAERRAKSKAGKAAACAANGIVAAAMRAMAAKAIGWPAEGLEPLRALVAMLAEIVHDEAREQVRVRRTEGSEDTRTIATLAANAASAPELLGLAAELIAARASEHWGRYDSVVTSDACAKDAFWQAWGVNKTKLLKEAAKERTEKASGKNGRSAKADRATQRANGAADIPNDIPVPEFRIGMDVVSKVTGRRGHITGRKSGGADRIELWFVEWDLQPGQKKKETAYQAADNLLLAPVAAEPWRDIALADIHLPVGAETAFRQMHLTSAGEVADWLDRQPDLAPKGIPGLRKALLDTVRAKIELLRGADVAPPSAADTLAAKAKARKCRTCGCTENDCRQCIEATGHPCVWVEEDLCSRCSDEEDAKLGAEMEAAHA